MSMKTEIRKILRGELKEALGCTEPVSIAYVSAKAREVLGSIPEEIEVACSENVIKNTKSVVVPMTGNLRGIEAACLIGAVGGKAEKGLEVLEDICETDIKKTDDLLKKGICKVVEAKTDEKFYVRVKMKYRNDEVVSVLKRTHLGINSICKNGKIIYQRVPDEEQEQMENYSCLTIENIFQYASEEDIGDVEDLIEDQIRCNEAISQEGLKNNYGACVGRILLRSYGGDIRTRARAAAAAGSDARMNGCELPVVINSGSGNQGMTVSLPVIEYSKYLKSKHETMIRALILSNLVAIYQKYKIGRLSAYCGVISAAAGAGAGITYLYGGSKKEIEDTITNTLANVSGIVCDGAGSSCAAKIASCVDAAILGSEMARRGSVFSPGDGIVKADLQSTVKSIIRLAKEGMEETDRVIVDIMMNA